MVRGAAVWALSQLMAQGEFEALAADKSLSEKDNSVLAEWALAARP
jgi:epoxyqueuosine reductase